MMGMGYITVHTKKHLSINFAGEFWIFLVLTVVFLIVTLGSYFLWVRQRPHWRYVKPRHSWSKGEPGL